jgi:hypothetical protein
MVMRSLLMDVKVGQTLSIDGGRIFITLEEKSGQRAKLRFVHSDASIERVDGAASGAKLAQMGTIAAP